LIGSLLASLTLTGESGSTTLADEGAESTPFIPDNPIFAAYILKRFTNEELIKAPRKESVYLALLGRSGLPIKYRQEALDGLAKLRETDALTELVAGIAYLDAQQTENEQEAADLATVQTELLGLLAAQPVADLTKRRGDLEKLAREAKRPISRRAAMAGLLFADRKVAPTWRLAAAHDDGLVDLLAAIGLLPAKHAAPLYQPLYTQVQPLLENAPSPEIRRAAIAAIVRLPGHDADTFAALTKFVQDDIERAAAIDALRAISAKQRPADQLPILAEALVDFVSDLPAGERTSPAGVAAFALADELADELPAAQGQQIRDALASVSVRVIQLEAVHHQMAYDKQLLVVKAGRPLELVFTNKDIMPHNLVVTAPGAWEEVGIAAELMAGQPGAAEKQFVPDSEKVLHASTMLQPEEVAKIAFTAPSEPGVYPYVCTFPGHWRRMYGALVVVNDVDAYLAANKPLPSVEELLGAPMIVAEWKTEDLLPALADVAHGRSYENGKKLFLQAACFGCHKVGEAGGAIGPELTKIAKKYKPDEILTEMIEPSKKLDPKYATLVVITVDGKVFRGTVVEETAAEYKLMENPLIKCEPIVVAKDDVDEATRSKLSPMPVGLLNILQKEEILDLMAYVIAGGDPGHPAFAQ
jgi:putative heme-binding domain-containing protein